MIRILVIDDDSREHRTLRMILPREYHLISSYRGYQGIEVAKKEFPDLVLLDIDLPDTNGIDVLKELALMPVAPPVIMLTAIAQIGLVVESMKHGAADYLVKPFELEKLTTAIKTYAPEKKPTKIPWNENPAFACLVGECGAMLEAKRLLAFYARSRSPVLITGESGTGKDLAARIVHNLSNRRDGPFVVRNCASIPDSLFETELFGSQRGAFTDAVDRAGSFELADGGSLFLDEIGELPPRLQAKLLRAIESSEVARVGSSRNRRCDVRIIAATNKNVIEALESGELRDDLFYRICTLPVSLPPLRQRPGDIPLLSAYLLKDAGARLSPRARQRLESYHWPGNVRELKNVLERAALFADDGVIDVSHIAFTFGQRGG